MNFSDLNDEQKKGVLDLSHKIYGSNDGTDMVSQCEESFDIDSGDIHNILQDEFGLTQCMNCMVFYNEIMNDDGECSNCQ